MHLSHDSDIGEPSWKEGGILLDIADDLIDGKQSACQSCARRTRQKFKWRWSYMEQDETNEKLDQKLVCLVDTLDIIPSLFLHVPIECRYPVVLSRFLAKRSRRSSRCLFYLQRQKLQQLYAIQEGTRPWTNPRPPTRKCRRVTAGSAGLGVHGRHRVWPRNGRQRTRFTPGRWNGDIRGAETFVIQQ